MTHKCAAACCDQIVADAMLMCSEHWFLVPRCLRERVNFTWRAHCNPNLSGNLKPYLAARRDAIAAVARAVEPVRG